MERQKVIKTEGYCTFPTTGYSGLTRMLPGKITVDVKYGSNWHEG